MRRYRRLQVQPGLLKMIRGGVLGLIGQQFGLPSGPLGRVAVRFMARNNGDFNRSVVEQLSSAVPGARLVAELGFGPGVGLAALLDAFPSARVFGADPSPAALSQATRRNRDAARTGRLRVLQGDASALTVYGPFDLIVAVHVVYFWHDQTDLTAVSAMLEPGGRLALGYQLKQHMPPVAQRDFPAEGHRLYESDGEVDAIVAAAGLTVERVSVIGPAESPAGRVLLASNRLAATVTG